MKVCNLILLVSPLLLGPIDPLTSAVIDHGFKITTSTIGPYYRNQQDDVEIKVTGSQLYQYNLKMVVKGMSDEIGEMILFSSQYQYYFKNQTRTFNWHLDNGYLKEPGLTMEFLLYKSTQTNPIVKIRVRLHAIDYKSIDISDPNRNIYNPFLTSFRILNNKAISYNDYFNFSQFPRVMSAPTYHILPIEESKFYYEKEFLLTYQRITLSFIDKDHLFPDLTKGYGKVEIPLRASLIGNGIYNLKINQPLFVNPVSLNMSFVKSNGLVPTNQLYLPVGQSKLFETYDFKFEMYDVGFAGYDYHCNLKYVKNKNLIGECENSKYCIVSGIDNG